ncbi:MAG: tetratricopeptide repeat protein [Deltaproteobacteria bacterium]|nr:tetratricopeptide repeat protein [Deltaproteobacteria bacterium]
MHGQGGRASRYGPFAALAIAIISVALVYSNALDSPFLFDDEIYIVNNEALRSLANFWPPTGSRYIGNLSFALDYRLHLLDPRGYHLVNIVIHIINSFLVYALVRLLTKTPALNALPRASAEAIAILTSLVFAVHPVQTESVTYITQRYASLAALFYLASVVFYLKARLGAGAGIRKLSYVLSIILAVFAMRTKEISFTLPFAVMLFEATLFGRGDAMARIKMMVPFAVTLLIIPLYFALHKAEAGMGISDSIVTLQKMELEGLSRYEYAITQFRVIVKYLRLLALPYGQNLLYEMKTYKSFFAPGVVSSFVFLLSVFIFSVLTLVRSLKNAGAYGILFSIGVLWFFLTLSIESSIIPIRDVIFEHRLYLPSVGAFIAFFSAFFYFLGRKGEGRAAPLILVFLIALPLGVIAHRRNEVWKDAFSLWSDVVEKSPESPLGRLNLGAAYYKKGLVKEAEGEFMESIRLDPSFNSARMNLAALYQETGRLDEAIAGFREALRRDPLNARALYNAGLTYGAKGLPGEAVIYYLAALKADPGYAEVYYALGDAYMGLDRPMDAVESYSLFIKKAPDQYRSYKDSAAIKINSVKRKGPASLP